MRITPKFRAYSRAERLSDAAIHVVGLLAALMAVPVLVTLAVFWRGDAAAVVGTLVYGVSLLAMLGCSALYHMVRVPGWRETFLRLDHTAIYFKIAGTYTPFTLLSGGQGMGLLALIWAAALAGSSLKIFAPRRFRVLALGLYLAMGWAGSIGGHGMISALSVPAFWLILAGGLIYTVGVLFFLMEEMPFHNTIWHGFVLVGSVVLFAALVVELAHAPARLA